MKRLVKYLYTTKNAGSRYSSGNKNPSRLTGIKISNKVALTGEIDLNGNIKKIGGLISKILGGYKAGIKTVIIPKENAPDLELIKKEGLMPKALKVILIDHVKDLIKKGLVANDLEFNYDNI